MTAEPPVDVAQITDVTLLKALAYEQVVIGQSAQHNLALIENRISQVLAQPTDLEPSNDSAL
jgi:predicted nucleic acid-binding protein